VSCSGCVGPAGGDPPAGAADRAALLTRHAHHRRRDGQDPCGGHWGYGLGLKKL